MSGGAHMHHDGDIVTVRPDAAVDTLQRLPNFVGISGRTAGASALSMNLFIPAGVPHQPINLSADTDAIALVARNDPDEQASVRAYDPAG